MPYESEAVMRTIGVLDLTVARESALQHAIERAEAAVPLIQRVAAIRAAALARADRPHASPLSEDERDALWTR